MTYTNTQLERIDLSQPSEEIFLFDLETDPNQLNNIAEETPQETLDVFFNYMRALYDCSGETCHELERQTVP